ncbi:stage V sporulation protein AA [Bacillus testis]|uniref:stage V sporulation protein AA n=1 Tax=Bacillus testis TaxID=1622072 RepID=UPI000AE86EC7|nr:stage V sporulation protein AA [Bacillus testis]
MHYIPNHFKTIGFFLLPYKIRLQFGSTLAKKSGNYWRFQDWYVVQAAIAYYTMKQLLERGEEMDQVLYIRMRQRVQVQDKRKLLIGDIARCVGPKDIVSQAESLPVYEISKADRNIIVIDLIMVIDVILRSMGSVELQAVGPNQTIIQVKPKQKKSNPLIFAVVWSLLFVGAGLTIMNFHEDVSMRAVHQKIYTILTGKLETKPLVLQIPYSIGLGLGMVLFFNHFFKKRFNEEPSPLEVEMFNYQQDLDHYVMVNENKESMVDLDDPDER